MRSAAEFVIAGNRNINNNARELYGWWLLESGGIDCHSAERLSSLCCSIKEEKLLINRAESVKRRETKKPSTVVVQCTVKHMPAIQA